MGGIRHLFANIVCGFIPNKDKRKKIRVLLNSPVMADIKFIHRDLGNEKISKLKTFIGYQARSLLISVNDKYIYKFPLRRTDYRELAMREKRVVDAFADISPVHIPTVEILDFDGILVRKYEFVHGAIMRQLPASEVLRHKTKIARQLAHVIHTIASADPESIRDLKPAPDAAPTKFCGWTQGDITDNFMLDPTTFDVVALIDWEDCFFGDFEARLTMDRRSPAVEVMSAVKSEYEKIWNKK